jgi:CDGSH-type Zn-finger protein
MSIREVREARGFGNARRYCLRMSTDAKIVIAPNGPYLVWGTPVELATIEPNADGASWEWTAGRAVPVGERYALCRCGASANKPFCDGTHAHNGFDGTETASRAPFAEQAKTLAGPGMILEDVEALCASARFCDVADSIWTSIERVDDPAERDLVIHEATHCPSGRLVVRDTATGAPHEPVFAASIGLVEDPAKTCSGPLYVRGGIPVVSADGSAYEVRNRVALCRRGESKNKPFCDGSHVDIGFSDGLS